jgi:hypothetical protein
MRTGTRPRPYNCNKICPALVAASQFSGCGLLFITLYAFTFNAGRKDEKALLRTLQKVIIVTISRQKGCYKEKTHG